MGVKVTLAGIEYAYEFSLKAMMFYEGMTGKSFGSENTLTSTIVTHYACLLSANGVAFMSFSEFTEVVKSREVLEQLSAVLEAELARWNGQNEALAAGAPVKKKKQKA